MAAIPEMTTEAISAELADLRLAIDAKQARRNALETEFHTRDQAAQLTKRSEEFLNSLSPTQREMLLKRNEESIAAKAKKAK